MVHGLVAPGTYGSSQIRIEPIYPELADEFLTFGASRKSFAYLF